MKIPKTDDELVDEILELRKTGRSWATIAKHTGLKDRFEVMAVLRRTGNQRKYNTKKRRAIAAKELEAQKKQEELEREELLHKRELEVLHAKRKVAYATLSTETKKRIKGFTESLDYFQDELEEYRIELNSIQRAIRMTLDIDSLRKFLKEYEKVERQERAKIKDSR